MMRFRYAPPWKVTRWGLLWPPVGRGFDEYHDQAVFVIVPFVGELVVFTGRSVDRSECHVYGMSEGRVLGRVVEGCDVCAELVAAMSEIDEEAIR